MYIQVDAIAFCRLEVIDLSFPILALTLNTPTQLEQLGTKGKFWFRNQNNETKLFKEGRPNTGENWAEKVCCEICRALGIPHAEYELATFGDQKGVITPTFVPEGGQLRHGNEVLSEIDDEYDDSTRFRSRQHQVSTVITVVSNPNIELPINWVSPDSAIADCASVFVGYLMLDALVSNQDRHHENWGLISMPGSNGQLHLAPSFDHASSLGRNESDETRSEMLTSKDKGRGVRAYVSRARSALYSTPPGRKPLGTVEAMEAAVAARPDAGVFWK